MSWDGASVVSSTKTRSCSLWFLTAGDEEARLWVMACTIIVRFWSINILKFSFWRNILKLLIALVCTFTLLSWTSLHSVSTSWMNLEGWVCRTVTECCYIHSLILSSDSNLLFQSLVLDELMRFLNSSINWGSTGFETDAYLFLKTWLEEPVIPKPFVEVAP